MRNRIIAVANSLLDDARHLEAIAGINQEVWGERLEVDQERDDLMRNAARLRRLSARMIQEQGEAGEPLVALETTIVGGDEELPF